MPAVMIDNRCLNCGIPVDAEQFDANGVLGRPQREDTSQHPPTLFDPFGNLNLPFPDTLPERGEQKTLAGFQLHPQYCGVLTHFAQYTDLYARDNSQLLTPGFEWIISQNGKPLFPYMRLEMIVNPWGCNCLPVVVRLDENARIEISIRNRFISDLANYPIKAFAGRIMGHYWYNESFGGS